MGNIDFIDQTLPPLLSFALLPKQAEPVARVAAELAKGRAVAHFVVSLARSALVEKRLKKKSEREAKQKGKKKTLELISKPLEFASLFFSIRRCVQGQPGMRVQSAPSLPALAERDAIADADSNEGLEIFVSTRKYE